MSLFLEKEKESPRDVLVFVGLVYVGKPRDCERVLDELKDREIRLVYVRTSGNKLYITDVDPRPEKEVKTN